MIHSTAFKSVIGIGTVIISCSLVDMLLLVLSERCHASDCFALRAQESGEGLG